MCPQLNGKLKTRVGIRLKLLLQVKNSRILAVPHGSTHETHDSYVSFYFFYVNGIYKLFLKSVFLSDYFICYKTCFDSYSVFIPTIDASKICAQ